MSKRHLEEASKRCKKKRERNRKLKKMASLPYILECLRVSKSFEPEKGRHGMEREKKTNDQRLTKKWEEKIIGIKTERDDAR